MRAKAKALAATRQMAFSESEFGIEGHFAGG
jgi:hypothetical protein